VIFSTCASFSISVIKSSSFIGEPVFNFIAFWPAQKASAPSEDGFGAAAFFYLFENGTTGDCLTKEIRGVPWARCHSF